MTHEEFETRVRDLERVAEASPRAYGLRVVAWAALAYGYIGAVMLLALGLTAGLVAALVFGEGRAALVKLVIKGGWALGALVVAVGRALWVRLDPPQGIPLAGEDHPELFAAIDRVRRHMRAPRAHHVLLTDDFNAAVVQRPRLGVLGWQRNYLILGLPLMQALSREQFEAVVAHEYGHLSGSHGRLGGWIYRTSATIGRLYEKMEAEEHWASFVFLPFFRWFWPRFNSVSFVQRRMQEYAADLGGAEIATTRQSADALLAVSLRGLFLDQRYWEAVKRRADEVPSPDVAPFSGMGPRIFDDLREEDAARWLEQLLARETTVDDSHPCLRDRLAALGEAARVPPRVEQSAAQVLLGGALPALAARLDEDWRQAVTQSWRARFEHVSEVRARLAELDARAGHEELAASETFERAELVEEQRGVDEALSLYRAALAREPGHVGANFAAGRILAERDDPECLIHLDSAIDAHPDAVIPGCRIAYGFLHRTGREEAAEQRYAVRARQHHERLEAAHRERATVALDAAYQPHGLGSAELAPMLEFLRGHPEVVRAWLVRRAVVHFPERPLFVLGVRRKRVPGDFVAMSTRRTRDLKFQEKLQAVPIPGEAFILVLNHRARRERRIFEHVAGSQILP